MKRYTKEDIALIRYNAWWEGYNDARRLELDYKFEELAIQEGKGSYEKLSKIFNRILNPRGRYHYLLKHISKLCRKGKAESWFT